MVYYRLLVNTTIYVCVAQLDRALGYGPRCRGFESSHARGESRSLYDFAIFLHNGIYDLQGEGAMEKLTTEGMMLYVVESIESSNKPILEKIDRLEKELTELRTIAQKNQGLLEEMYQGLNMLMSKNS